MGAVAVGQTRPDQTRPDSKYTASNTGSLAQQSHVQLDQNSHARFMFPLFHPAGSPRPTQLSSSKLQSRSLTNIPNSQLHDARKPSSSLSDLLLLQLLLAILDLVWFGVGKTLAHDSRVSTYDHLPDNGARLATLVYVRSSIQVLTHWNYNKMSQGPRPTFINLPPPGSNPDTPSEMPYVSPNV